MTDTLATDRLAGCGTQMRLELREIIDRATALLNGLSDAEVASDMVRETSLSAGATGSIGSRWDLVVKAATEATTIMRLTGQEL